jgi:hypothetical protein
MGQVVKFNQPMAEQLIASLSNIRALGGVTTVSGQVASGLVHKTSFLGQGGIGGQGRPAGGFEADIGPLLPGGEDDTTSAPRPGWEGEDWEPEPRPWIDEPISPRKA